MEEGTLLEEQKQSVRTTSEQGKEQKMVPIGSWLCYAGRHQFITKKMDDRFSYG